MAPRKNDDPTARAVADAEARRAEQETRNAEAMRYMDETRPVPSQEELDKAKLGALPDGPDTSATPTEAEVARLSEPTTEVRSASTIDAAPYKNRAAKTGE